MTDALLPKPKVAAPLDPDFRPAVLAARAFQTGAREATGPRINIAIEQSDGSMSAHGMHVFPEGHPHAGQNPRFVERLVKLLLWSRGGYRFHVDGSQSLVDHLQRHMEETETGRFDSDMIGVQVYGKAVEFRAAAELPTESAQTKRLGRHLDGCRIGFDLGGSDRKVAAVVNGEVIFSEETVWDPYHQPDPDYHKNGILDSLRKAAQHLPRIDAIGGSAAGVYVNSQPRQGSLFRGIDRALFEQRVKPMFQEIQKEMGGMPFEVVNDGEVTALAGAMSLKDDAVLGIALGTSTAAGYVTPEGNITNWLNELAFVPVDYNPEAPADEWSLDRGCGVQYLSQQAVGRLLKPAGIELDDSLSLPQKLVEVQNLMKDDDPRAQKIYETVGTYLGYAVAHFASFYEIRNVLVLGRVTSGKGGDIMVDWARKVLAAEFPTLTTSIKFVMPDEKMKRHGQAIAAASLPALRL